MFIKHHPPRKGVAAVRNIQVKLDVPEDTHDVLEETFEQFRGADQYVADYDWTDNSIEIMESTRRKPTTLGMGRSRQLGIGQHSDDRPTPDV